MTARISLPLLFSIVACLIAATGARAQDTVSFPVSAVPARGARVQEFVPRGYTIAAREDGDLNGDGRPDHVLHLVPRNTYYRPDAITAAPEVHALVIVLTDGRGLRRAGVAPRLLQAVVPQWGLQLTIRRGVLIVNQNFGMTEVLDLTHRFRLDPATGRFLLIGRDQLFYTRPQERQDSEKRSENYLTGVRLSTTGHFDASGRYTERERRERIPRTRTYFDEVNEVDGSRRPRPCAGTRACEAKFGADGSFLAGPPRPRDDPFHCGREEHTMAMIDELVQQISQRTGLAPDKAQQAAHAAIDFLDSRLPPPIGGQLRTMVGGGGAGGEGGGGMPDLGKMAGGLGGMFGKGGS